MPAAPTHRKTTHTSLISRPELTARQTSVMREGPRVNAARGVALGALVLAVAVVAVLLLRGDGGTTYKLRFQNAGQLVKDDDVQVGGRRIGSVRKIALTDNNQAEITIAVAGALRAAARGDDGARSGPPRCRASPTATSR